MTKGSGLRRQAECASERHRYLVCAVSAGIQTWNIAVNPSASLLRDWLEHGIFVWLVTDKLLSEYKAILKRLCMRRHPVGQIINTLREKAKFVNIREERDVSPNRTTMQPARVRSKAVLPLYEGLPSEDTCG
jgi:hypothetical protein